MPDLGVVQPATVSAHGAQRPAWKRWLRAASAEPLVQFLALGAALFLLWPFVADRVAPPPNRIVISAGRMQRAVEIFDKTHARAPDAQELSDLAAQEVQTEVYYREGIALGLDRDDEIIRRRLQQKLTFMIQDIVDQSPPSDAELQHFLDTHPAEFAAEPQIAFSQVYLNPEQHGVKLDADSARLLAHLNASDGRLDYGADSDVLPVPNDFEATPLHEISSMFGEDFATAIAAQPAGRWMGPVHSGYGVHLVLVRQHIDGKPPKLSDIHDAVLREWQSARRDAANAEAYRQMRAKYTVQIDMPPAGAQ